MNNMNNINLYIGSLIVSHINDTISYSALRQTNKFFYFLMPKVKRFIDSKLVESIPIINHKIIGKHVCWYPDGTPKALSLYINNQISSKNRDIMVKTNQFNSSKSSKIKQFNSISPILLYQIFISI